VRRVAAYRDGLEHEEHPTCEICVGVLIASDLAAQIFKPDQLPKMSGAPVELGVKVISAGR
jgi:hypothetical protein